MIIRCWQSSRRYPAKYLTRSEGQMADRPNRLDPAVSGDACFGPGYQSLDWFARAFYSELAAGRSGRRRAESAGGRVGQHSVIVPAVADDAFLCMVHCWFPAAARTPASATARGNSAEGIGRAQRETC